MIFYFIGLGIVFLIYMVVGNRNKIKMLFCKPKRNYGEEVLNWMQRETERIRKQLNYAPKFNVTEGQAVFQIYDRKISIVVKHVSENKFEYVYKNLLRHRIKYFDNFDKFKSFYYINKMKMISSIKCDKGIYD